MAGSSWQRCCTASKEGSIRPDKSDRLDNLQSQVVAVAYSGADGPLHRLAVCQPLHEYDAGVL